MKKITLMSILMLSVFMGYSQEDEDDDKTSLSVALVSDTFFGFAPMVTGDYILNEKTSFTFYGIFWSGGTGSSWGNWAEFGAGVNFQVSDAININPQLGVLSGNLLSSFTEGPSVIGDGLVPNLIVGLDTEQLEGELYFGYYLPLRSEGATTSNFIHYWANAGYKFSDFVSSGLHFEQLYGGADGGESSVYKWFGPYIQFSDLKGRGFLRFAAGVDLEDTPGNNSFYKMSFGFNF
jgi:hypothetical protein